MKPTLKFLKYPLLVCSSLYISLAHSADFISGPSNDQIVKALGISPSQLVSITTNDTDPLAIGIADTSAYGIIEDPKSGNNSAPYSSLYLSNSYPTEGRSYVVLGSGDVSLVGTANTSDGTSTTLGGLQTPDPNGNQDMGQIDIVLRAPESARCASIDFSFFSEEYNEFIGSNFNDTFIIEKDTSSFTINSDFSVDEPNNFAFDTAGNVISVNAAFDTVCNPAASTPEECSTGTTYDNATIKLRASTPVNGGTDVRLIFSIMDLGDSVYDSAVFLDNFQWQTSDCASGAQEIEDADGDGLLDDWETNGVTIAAPGQDPAFINLPAMGADPLVKDLFIELDWMEQSGAVTYRPLPEMLTKVIAAYAAIGVNAHIDAGPDSFMDPTSEQTWGDLSASNAIGLVDTLGTASGTFYDWTAFDELKSTHFNASRHPVFHYGIIGHRSPFAGVPYISRDLNSSDFFLPFGDLLGTINEQAGSLLKATGLNLALREGGRDNIRAKPHYLSVMNPLYTFNGIILNGVDGNLAFADTSLDSLNEAALNETTALPAATNGDSRGVKHYCGGAGVISPDASNGTDWNCDGLFGEAVVVDVNNSGQSDETLTATVDLNGMRFSGGLIGKNDSLVELPQLTEVLEYAQSSPISKAIPDYFKVSVIMSAATNLDGSSFTQQAVIRNLGATTDTYTLNTSSSLDGADFSGLAQSYTIGAGERVTISFPVTLPSSADDTDTVKLTAVSQTHDTISDIGVIYVTGTSVTAGPGGQFATILFEDGNPFQVKSGGGSLQWSWLAMLAVFSLLGHRKSLLAKKTEEGKRT